MQPLEALAREAAALTRRPKSAPGLTDAGEDEVARVMQICNACRYCEGFCAVFPAMTRRLEFGKADVTLPRQPLPQLRRLPARVPVRAAARIRRQRAAGDGEGARANLRGIRVAAGVRRALPAQRPDGASLALACARAVPGACGRAKGRAMGGGAGGQLLRDLSAQPDGGDVRAGVRVRDCSRSALACADSGARSQPDQRGQRCGRRPLGEATARRAARSSTSTVDTARAATTRTTASR